MLRSPSPDSKAALAAAWEAAQASLLDEFHSRCILCGCHYDGPHTKIFDPEQSGQYHRATATWLSLNCDPNYPWDTAQNGLLLCPQCAPIRPDACYAPATLVPCRQLLQYVTEYLQQPDKDFQVTSVDEILAELEANPDQLDPERKTVPFLHCYELLVFRPEDMPSTIPIYHHPTTLVAGSPPRRYQVFDPTEPHERDATPEGTMHIKLGKKSPTDDTVLWKIRRPPGSFLMFALDMCRKSARGELSDLAILIYNIWQLCFPTISVFRRKGIPINEPKLYHGPPAPAVEAVVHLCRPGTAQM
ncbi:hypothetical protein C8Q76DRAFT_42867 [Earliella scabrosa]|nr:hypothetical protein C8Q76DRAFT_42867 [Earliella scabrosa]